MSDRERERDSEERRYAREEDLLDAIRNSEWESLRRQCEEPSDEGWG